MVEDTGNSIKSRSTFMVVDRDMENSKLLEENAKVLEDFKLEYPNKYIIIDGRPLGMGVYGAVFKAFDVDRKIEVAIKIHHDGIAPDGSERGWTISTVVNHPQIANTYTIETFKSRDSKICKAVVSKFVPGIALKKMYEELVELEDSNREIIQEDLAHSLVPSILKALNYCHALGYGHGDLHAGNIMVFLSDLAGRYELHAVLIDFDNSSIRGEALCHNEDEKIEKDYRSVKRVISQAIEDWADFDVLNILLDGYSETSNLYFAWEKIMKFINLSTTSSINKNVISTFLKSLIDLELSKEDLKPILRAVVEVCKRKGKDEECGWAIEDFENAYRKYENLADMRFDYFVIKDVEVKTSFYNALFGIAHY